MIKLLIKPQCFKYVFYSCIHEFSIKTLTLIFSRPSFYHNTPLRFNNLFQFKSNNISKTWTKNYKTFTPSKTTVQRTNSNRLLSLFGGGTVVCVIGLWKHKNCFVHCNTNRLSDFDTYFDHQPHEAKFNWSKFWHYLKPHLFKLIAAICVNKNQYNFYDNKIMKFIYRLH